MTIGAGHAPLDGSATTNRLAYMVTVNASDAANGTLPIHMHAIWRWDLGEGDRAVGITMPAVMQKNLPFVGTGWGGVVSTARDHFVVTAVGPSCSARLVKLFCDMADIVFPPALRHKKN